MSKKQVASYILDRRIGKGSYATVWKGRVEGGEEAVAVKVISRQTVTETSQLRQEVEVLRRISHPNIVRFRDLKKSAAHFYLVLEFCAGGDLSQFLREKGRVPEAAARRFLTQIAAGLCTLHRENVLHRDLKPQNILLSDGSDEPVLKIADFGFARALQPQDMAATVCGSPLYMAPEILRHEPYDAKADLWSVGAILFELLLGKTPFSGANPMQLLANIEKTERVSFEGISLSSEGQEFLRALLMRSPAQRLSSLDFAGHAYVGGEAMSASTEALVYSESLVEPCEWCVAAEATESSDAADAPPSLVASPTGCQSPATSPRGEPSAEPPPEPQDDYVVVAAQQPISAWARRGPTPRAAARDFCRNLARIAGALEGLARRLHDSPLEALALLLRALGLLEKALSVEEEATESLRRAYQRTLEAADAAAAQVRASAQPPARPDSLLFELAVQQAKDAAVALSKGHEVGGWEAPCLERLTLALLLLDLLGSEADGEDLAIIRGYTAPIAKLIAGIEHLGRPPSPQLQPGP